MYTSSEVQTANKNDRYTKESAKKNLLHVHAKYRPQGKKLVIS